ncbi:hypothetical protein [Nonomuraea sp. NPDC049758]|uniref:hypothetical protein n=1 Tax=Nonomuraea sp. NPDC049758 TaxID=3154360 RepID=UPI003414304E
MVATAALTVQQNPSSQYEIVFPERDTITLNGQRQEFGDGSGQCWSSGALSESRQGWEYEHFYNHHRAGQALDRAAPLRTVPDPLTDPEQIIDLNIWRRDRLGGVLREYSHAA